MQDTAYNRNFPYLYRGIVESNEDPDSLGRCKVRVPFIHGELTYPASALPWARPIVLSPVKSGRGSVNLPDIGDVVWVFFEGADKKFPVYLGGTYAKGEIDTNPNIVDFYIEDESKISYDRLHKKYSISIGECTLELSSEGINISGDLNISGNLTVSGTTTLNNLIVKGDYSREGDDN